MNTFMTQGAARGCRLAGIALSSLLLVACAMSPASPQGAAEARSRLTALQSSPGLAGKARVEIREAEAAVRLAEQPLPEAERALGAHRVYMADRRVAIAEAIATTQLAEEQRTRLGEARDAARLQARTREADRARDDASIARSEASRAREDASRARTATAMANEEASRARRSADAARSSESSANAIAAREAAEYQRQIDKLQAATTERGLVLTLGDVLFATDSARLQSGANANLDKLVSFLNEYPDRRVLIEGHTDNVGNSQYNRELSQQRANSVRAYLTQQGIAARTLSATGIGMDRPIAGNETASGRQQNRRVEIIIENPPEPVEQRRL